MTYLKVLIFSTGAVTLGMELTAARLLEPALGSNQLLWATLIGMILLYLAVGSWLGGRLADRYPQRRAFDIAMVTAGISVGMIPLLSRPILRLAVHGIAAFAPLMLALAMLAVLLLFSVPGVLLGTATPWAIRLSLLNMERAGETVGQFHALATAGSIVGAFLPVLWLIPTFGVRWTFYLLALWLLTVVLIGSRSRRHLWVAATGIAIVAVLMWLARPDAPLRSAWEQETGGEIIFEDETFYNYVAVRRWGSERHLEINDGIGIHSVYHPETLLSLGIWDYFLLAPLASPSSVAVLEDGVLVIGLAAGTVPSLFTTVYGEVPLTGIELDPAIIEIGRRYFDMVQPNLTSVAADGRRWLAVQENRQRWGIIAIDAYRPPYIPFHLATVEFFTEVRNHLAGDGVLAVNVGRTDTNYELVDALVATIRQVLPYVLVVDEPGPPDTLSNSLVLAANKPISAELLRRNLDGMANQLPEEFVDFASTATEFVREAAATDAPILTDDRAPVEQIVHRIIFDYLTGGVASSAGAGIGN